MRMESIQQQEHVNVVENGSNEPEYANDEPMDFIEVKEGEVVNDKQ